jgi:hypothetical protein
MFARPLVSEALTASALSFRSDAIAVSFVALRQPVIVVISLLE